MILLSETQVLILTAAYKVPSLGWCLPWLLESRIQKYTTTLLHLYALQKIAATEHACSLVPQHKNDEFLIALSNKSTFSNNFVYSQAPLYFYESFKVLHLHIVTRPFCLVESRSQDAAANAGVLSVYLTNILHYHRQFFIDIERENIFCTTIGSCSLTLKERIYLVSIHRVALFDILACNLH